MDTDTVTQTRMKRFIILCCFKNLFGLHINFNMSRHSFLQFAISFVNERTMLQEECLKGYSFSLATLTKLKYLVLLCCKTSFC